MESACVIHNSMPQNICHLGSEKCLIPTRVGEEEDVVALQVAVQNRAGLMCMQVSHAGDDVMNEAQLDLRLANNLLHAFVQHSTKAATIGTFHEKAQPLRVVKYHTNQGDDVCVHRLVQGAELMPQ